MYTIQGLKAGKGWITVTALHIKEGKTHVAAECPVALALIEAGYTNPIVSPTSTLIPVSPIENLRLDHSDGLSKWILAFDAGQDVAPIEVLALCNNITTKEELCGD